MAMVLGTATGFGLHTGRTGLGVASLSVSGSGGLFRYGGRVEVAPCTIASRIASLRGCGVEGEGLGRRAAMAMSSAVFTPLPISSSLRCSAAEPCNNGATFSNNSVRLPHLAVSTSQPLSLNNGEASASAMSVLHPGLEFVNVMYFKGSYNTQVFVGEDEPADSVVRRFRKAVMQAGVIPECRRRRFHETPQDIVKRKQQNARRRKLSNRRFTGPRPEGGFGEKTETKSKADDDDDFWGYAEEGADAHL